MNEKEGKHPDPLMDEVRQRRRELLAQHDHDLGRLYATIERRQKAHPEKFFDLRKTKTLRP